MNELSGTSK